MPVPLDHFVSHFDSKAEMISSTQLIRDKAVNYLLRSTREVIGDTSLQWVRIHDKFYSSICYSFAYDGGAIVCNDRVSVSPQHA